MEIRDFARSVVESDDLEIKLTPPAEPLTDHEPGPPLRIPWPTRPAGLEIAGEPVKVPSVEGLADPQQRRRILHGLANHELQATELFAWALLAFPEAPGEFRRGLLRILQDEQRHTRMYIARLEAHGGRFGDHAVSGYFWSKAEHWTSPLDFICAMSLTFENANLDHTVESLEAAARAGDAKTAAVIEKVQEDEVEHVRFGWTWLQRFKEPGESRWEAYRRSLTWPLRPVKAKGKPFNVESRRAAGLDEEFIRKLAESEP